MPYSHGIVISIEDARKGCNMYIEYEIHGEATVLKRGVYDLDEHFSREEFAKIASEALKNGHTVITKKQK